MCNAHTTHPSTPVSQGLRGWRVRRLDSRSLACFGSACRYFFDLTRDIVADLRVKLFPHQKAALTKMLGCEVLFSRTPSSAAGKTSVLDPEFRLYKGHTGENVYISQLNGCVRFSEDSIQIPRIRGGLLCDEPGLGKTVTSLALISKTRGALAQIGDGENVQVQVDETLAQNRLIEYARGRRTPVDEEGQVGGGGLKDEYIIPKPKARRGSEAAGSEKCAAQRVPAQVSMVLPQRNRRHQRVCKAQETGGSCACQRKDRGRLLQGEKHQARL